MTRNDDIWNDQMRINSKKIMAVQNHKRMEKREGSFCFDYDIFISLLMLGKKRIFVSEKWQFRC